MKNILVVGASSTIGEAIVSRFLEHGDRVAGTYYSRNQVKRVTGMLPLRLDLSSPTSIRSLTKQIKKEFGSLDIVLFLSGLLPGKNLAGYSFSEMDQVMEVNFGGQAKTLQQLVPLLKPSAQICFISSIAAQKGSFDPIYSAAKGAILSFVKSLASGLGPGIRVNAIAPGLIQDSAMYKDMSPKRREFHRSKTPNGQFLHIQDLANILFDLSQDHWKHLNGACIDLNGGYYVR